MIDYSEHAKDRMRERGFTEEEVAYCLNNYHTSYNDSKGKSVYRATTESGRKMRVVATYENNLYFIITVADES